MDDILAASLPDAHLSLTTAAKTHHVSDIDGFNNVRMRDATSLNDLVSRLATIGFDINRNDPAGMDPNQYPALFGPPLPELGATTVGSGD